MSRYQLPIVACGIVVVSLICGGFAYAIGASGTPGIDEAQSAKQQSNVSARAVGKKVAFKAARTSAVKQGRRQGIRLGRRSGSQKGRQAGESEKAAQLAAAEKKTQEQAIQYPPSFYQRPCPLGLSYTPPPWAFQGVVRGWDRETASSCI